MTTLGSSGLRLSINIPFILENLGLCQVICVPPETSPFPSPLILVGWCLQGGEEYWLMSPLGSRVKANTPCRQAGAMLQGTGPRWLRIRWPLLQFNRANLPLNPSWTLPLEGKTERPQDFRNSSRFLSLLVVHTMCQVWCFSWNHSSSYFEQKEQFDGYC